MDLKELHYFFNVARARSFSAGAKMSFVSPPAMSKAIKRLEEDLGVDLFRRTTRQVVLTERGRILFDHCRQVFRQIDDMRRAVDATDDSVRGDLRIAAMEVLSIYLLPNALARVLREHPDVRPRSYEMTPERMVAGLTNGDIDVAFTIGDQPSTGVTRRLLARSEGVLVCGRDHPLYEGGEVDAAALDTHPSVVPRFFEREYLTTLDQFPDDVYPRRVGATIELMQMGVQLAIDGAYLGYFPEVSIRCYLADGRLKALTGLQPGAPFELVALTPKGGTLPATELLIEALTANLLESDGPICH